MEYIVFRYGFFRDIVWFDVIVIFVRLCGRGDLLDVMEVISYV